MKNKKRRIFAGIDLGSYNHQVCVINQTGEVLAELCFAHTAEGLQELVRWLVMLAEEYGAEVEVGIEKPHGAVVETILEHEMVVYSINPKQVDRFRDRHSVSGAKDDRRDAFVIADAMRTDSHRFQRVCLTSPEVINLRELLRMDSELGKQEIVLANRLREQLLRCLPHLLKLAPKNLIDPFFWEVLQRFSMPGQAPQPDKQSIQNLLHKYHIRRLQPEQVLEILRMPALQVAPGTLKAVSSHIGLLVSQLRVTHEQRQHCTKQMEKQLKQLGALRKGANKDITHYSDAAILSSLPGVGTIVLATLLSQASEAIRLRDLAAIRVLGGVAPVTKQSGKRRQIIMRRSRDRHLSYALHHWARRAVMTDPLFKQHYDMMRARGHGYARALRGVMDRILGVAMAMLQKGTIYDASKRRVTKKKSGDEE